MFKILGRYRGVTEEVDTADTLEEAEYLVKEYSIAFGSKWLITISQ